MGKITALLISMALSVSAAETSPLFFDETFSGWQLQIGEWKCVGSALINPDQPQRLNSLPGQGVVINGENGNTRHLISRDDFGDVRLHIEFMIPQESNSGIYFMGRYEIQIRDSYHADSNYAGNECGGIYQRWDEMREPKGFEGVSPRVDAAKAPGEWQWFDVVFRAPRFDQHGRKIRNACFEQVYHNGFLIHQDVQASGPTRSSLFEDEKPQGPLMLQGDHGAVAYRNLRVFPCDSSPFFAMDTGVHDERHPSFEQQSAMLQELGYDGMDHTGVQNLAAKLQALDQHALRLFAVYLDVWADRDQQSYNDGLESALPLLKDRNVVLWVPIRSHDFNPSDPAGDQYAVQIVRRIADLAQGYGLTVALYPHSFFMMEKISDAVRIVRQVDRANVGVTYNLCHWLRTDRHDLSATLLGASPFLRLVTLNGADHQGEWKELIQPLDMGEFNVSQLVEVLKEIKYTNPIGLQGYGIGGDVEENLRRSMRAWRKLQQR